MKRRKEQKKQSKVALKEQEKLGDIIYNHRRPLQGASYSGFRLVTVSMNTESSTAGEDDNIISLFRHIEALGSGPWQRLIDFAEVLAEYYGAPGARRCHLRLVTTEDAEDPVHK